MVDSDPDSWLLATTPGDSDSDSDSASLARMMLSVGSRALGMRWSGIFMTGQKRGDSSDDAPGTAHIAIRWNDPRPIPDEKPPRHLMSGFVP